MTTKQFEVKARENSISGGAALDTGITVAQGNRLLISVPENDTWACGEGDRTSNANGLVVGNAHGGAHGNWTFPTTGDTFPFGSLVGSLDGGKTFFLVGTHFDKPAPLEGELSLYFWDANASDNTGSVTASISVAQGKAFLISDNWQNLPAGFTGSFDAIVNGASKYNGKFYIFKGDKYIRCDWSTHKADPGFPKAISAGWHGLPDNFKSGISGAVNGQRQFGGKCYLFKGDSYVRYDWVADKMDSGYPIKIAGHWPGLPAGFTSDFDAIINGNGPFADKLYFFKGDSYVRYDWLADKTDPDYPKKIVDGWHELPPGYTSGFNAAVEGDKQFVGKGYLFKGDYFIRYDWAADRADS